MNSNFRKTLAAIVSVLTLCLASVKPTEAGITYDIRFGQSNYNVGFGQSTMVSLYLNERYDGVSGTGQHRIDNINGLVFGNIGATITNSIPAGGSFFSADPVTGTGFDGLGNTTFRDLPMTTASVLQGTNFGSPNVTGTLTLLPGGSSIRSILLAQFQITAGASGVDNLTPFDLNPGFGLDDLVIDDGGSGYVIDSDPSLTFVNSTITAVPEPSSMALIGVSALALGWRRMRRAKSGNAE